MAYKVIITHETRVISAKEMATLVLLSELEAVHGIRQHTQFSHEEETVDKNHTAIILRLHQDGESSCTKSENSAGI